MSSNPVHGEVYSIQHYVIKFVSDLRQIRGFLSVRFPPLINLAFTIFKDLSQFLFGSWRNNLNQVVHTVYPALRKGVYNLIEIISNEPKK